MSRQLIHLNTAGAGLMPEPVVTAMTECLTREAAAGAYETEGHYDDILQNGVYQRLGRVLGARSEEIR